jgi:hypothetical protein
MLSHDVPSDFEIANNLYKPSYISLVYALSYYHIIPEITYTITSVTPRRTYQFEVAGKIFRYHRIKKEAFTGYSPEKIGGKVVLIADKEKALVDYLYFAERNKISINERIDFSSLSKEKVINYGRLFQWKSLMRLIGDLYA